MQSVKVPYSKSIAARLLVIQLLSGVRQPTKLDEVLSESQCVDIEVMKTAVNKLHSAVNNVEIDLQDSGTAKHLLTAVCACRPELKATLKMSQRLGDRPFEFLPDFFNFSRAQTVKVKPREIEIKGGDFYGIDLPLQFPSLKSSQSITAILLVAGIGKNPMQIVLNGFQPSLPYIRMTIELMRKCGINVNFTGKSIRVEPGQYTAPSPELMERDWSAASFFYEYSFVTGAKVDIEGLTPPEKSVQGDSAIAGIFKNATRSVTMNMRDTPDLVPPVAIGCALKGIPFNLFGISHLRYKESDRIEALRNVLECFGIKVYTGADSIEMIKPQPLKRPGIPLPCYNDHRIAMALAPAAAIFPGIRLDNPDCVDKSFPNFWEQMRSLGVNIKQALSRRSN